MFETVDHRIAVGWATDCSEHILPYFEKIYSQDQRPSKAIEVGRA
ncbi:putative immunity protein [Virgibacillus byunsanensis]|uniref:Immunity protein n=1 Tax=Virgibacillus byunsanensis TaxID=570945 RepID=A0ABW3LMW0_9BACI